MTFHHRAAPADASHELAHVLGEIGLMAERMTALADLFQLAMSHGDARLLATSSIVVVDVIRDQAARLDNLETRARAVALPSHAETAA